MVYSYWNGLLAANLEASIRTALKILQITPGISNTLLKCLNQNILIILIVTY